MTRENAPQAPPVRSPVKPPSTPNGRPAAATGKGQQQAQAAGHPDERSGSD
jgi:hypothetical protein